ncbi:MAG TPA: PH domain-containing protein [Alphaproteobacteria bacterium]|jgi:uncharacterized membrane protein YdbT with pleckstrin-like domain|nr:PH domain-containing protein [Alphaproteobacteria bacterium]
MSYVDKVLQPGEQVLYRGRRHWIVYLPASTLIAVALLLAIASTVVVPTQSQSLGWFLLGAAVIGAVGLMMWIAAWIRRISTELAVTDRRVIVKSGLIRRTTMEMNRSKIESVLVEQGLMARLFDYGTIIVKGTGGGFEPVDSIDEPLAFRSAITAG